MSISEIEACVQTLDSQKYSLACQFGDEPSAAAIDAFETQIGFDLPADFREFLTHPLGGLHLEAAENVWPISRPFASGPFWSFLRGLMIYSLSEKAPRSCNSGVHGWT